MSKLDRAERWPDAILALLLRVLAKHSVMVDDRRGAHYIFQCGARIAIVSPIKHPEFGEYLAGAQIEELCTELDLDTLLIYCDLNAAHKPKSQAPAAIEDP